MALFALTLGACSVRVYRCRIYHVTVKLIIIDCDCKVCVHYFMSAYLILYVGSQKRLKTIFGIIYAVSWIETARPAPAEQAYPPSLL